MRKKTVISGVASVLVIAGLALLPFAVEMAKKSEREELQLQQDQAQYRSISRTLSGAGALEEQEAQKVELPDGVVIEKYIVKNGDAVEAGQALAYIDRRSVLRAMDSVQSSMEALEQTMTDTASRAHSIYVQSPANGTVTAVYAKEGDDVRQVMLKYGALAVVEIEGKEWKAQAYVGTVSGCLAREGQTVYPYSTLFTLSDTADSSAYDTAFAQHQEYESFMQRLAVLYRDGVLSAPCAGIVSDIDETAAKQLEKTRTYLVGEPLRADAQTVPVLELLANEPEPVTEENPAPVLNYIGMVVGKGENSLSVRFLPADFPVTDYSAISENYTLKDFISSTVTNDVTPGNFYVYSDPEWFRYPLPLVNKGDLFLFAYDGETNLTSPLWEVYLRHLDYSESNTNGTQGDSMDALRQQFAGSSMGSSTKSSASAISMYSLDCESVMTVTPQDRISVSMIVDELDILSVTVGQSASVTVDALTGKTFIGRVSEIRTEPNNNGGNTKYTVSIELPRERVMLAGMNASATILVSEADHVLALPAAALVEEPGQTVVYTSFDEKTDLPVAPRVVKTGVSDGEYVQILSGIEEGERVFYLYRDHLSLSEFR